MIYILLTWILAPAWWPICLVRKMVAREPQRIVVFEIAGIGDVVCSAYLFERLRAHYPNANIDLVIDPIAASLAPALPMVDRVVEFPYVRQRGLVGRLRLIRLCANYDTGICLIPSAAQLSAFCLAGLPRRLSVLPGPLNRSYRWLRPLLTHVAVHEPGEYFPQTQADLIMRLGLPAAKALKKLRLNHRAFAEPLLDDASTLYVGILVGSGRALKRLSLPQLVSLVCGIVALPQNRSVKAVLLGGPVDREIARSIQDALEPAVKAQIVDLTGKFTLAELPAVIARLSLLIGVDSGVTHMADALDVPLICIAGPVDIHEVYEMGPHRVLMSAPDLPCYPCSRVFDTPTECRPGHRKCLQDLDARTILAHAKALLEMARG